MIPGKLIFAAITVGAVAGSQVAAHGDPAIVDQPHTHEQRAAPSTPSSRFTITSTTSATATISTFTANSIG
jgi:hypothetical protein